MEGRIRQLEHLLETLGDHRGRRRRHASPPARSSRIVYEGDSPRHGRALPDRPHGGEDRRPRRRQPQLPARVGPDRHAPGRHRRVRGAERQVARRGRRGRGAPRREHRSSTTTSPRPDACPTARRSSCPGGARRSPGTSAARPAHRSVLLLHGWTANADLNFFTCYRPLGEHFRVVAIDHRGHGRGIRTRKAFRLEDCADDAAALCDLLGIDSVIPIGYSMGGTIAQLMWRRHPQLVRGLVLGATLGLLPHLAAGAARLHRPRRPGPHRPADTGAGPLVGAAPVLPEGQGGHLGAVGAGAGRPARLADGARSRQGDRRVRRPDVARRGRRTGQHDRDDARPRRAGAPPDPSVPGDQGLRGVPHRRRPRRDPRQAGVPPLLVRAVESVVERS